MKSKEEKDAQRDRKAMYAELDRKEQLKNMFGSADDMRAQLAAMGVREISGKRIRL